MSGAAILPASPQQQWEYLNNPSGTGSINLAVGWRITGHLDVRIVQEVLTVIASRHEILRTHVDRLGGEVVQVILPDPEIPVNYVDLCASPARRRSRQPARFVVDELKQRFRLAQGPHIRAFLLRIADREHVLLLIVSHNIWDGASRDVFLREFVQLYRGIAEGRKKVLDELEVQYGDVTEWDRARALETIERDASDERRTNPPCDSGLPVDHDRVRMFGHCVRTVHVPPVRSWAIDALDRLARECGGTPVMGMAAALSVLLHMRTGYEQLDIGLVRANRDRPEKQALLGYLAGIVPLSVDVSGDPTFRQLLRRVRDATRAQYETVPAMRHAFPRLSETGTTQRSSACAVLLNYIPREFVHQNECTAGDLTARAYVPAKWHMTFDGATLWQYSDLDFSMLPLAGGSGFYGRLGFNRAALDPSLVAGLGGDFGRLLRVIALRPDRRVSALVRKLRDLNRLLPHAAFTWPSPESGFAASDEFGADAVAFVGDR